jgi:PAS domain S-box-containing protein
MAMARTQSARLAELTRSADAGRRLLQLVRWSLELPFVARVALAIGATVAVALFQFAVFPPPIAPFVFFYVAVVVATWIGGGGMGALSILLSAALANYAFMVPESAFATSASSLTATALFVVAASVVVLLCAAFRRALLRAEVVAEALRESEARFRQVANAMPQLVWTAEPDGKVDYYNDRVDEFSGFERAEDGSWRWEPVLHPDDLSRSVERWEGAVRSGTGYEIAHRVLRADGAYRWFLSRAVPVRDASGRIVKWIGTATDIDAQKRAEDALKGADRRKDDFLATLSHELRNPLAPIRTGASLLLRAPPGSPQAERARQMIERQVGHLTRLVDDLLDVTRITRGKIRLERERLDLCSLVRRTAEDYRQILEASQLSLEVRTCASVLVMADPDRLSQVVGNLLGNAAKFTSPGGHVTLTVDREDGEGIIRVRDDGRGIRAEDLDRLFEPFTQAEQSLARTQGGLGLGLALVRGLVKMHGGSVHAESAGEGQGAEFIIRLPLVSGERIDAVVEPRPVVPGRRLRLLLIEDNPDVAESLRDLLDLSGHEVEIAHSGPEGIERARVFQPDAAICDLGLPGIDGYEVARRMRADPGLSEVRLFALSGYGRPEDVARSKAAGFDLHLAKPPNLPALEAALGKLEPEHPVPAPAGTGYGEA